MTAGTVHSIRPDRPLVPGSPGWAYQLDKAGPGRIFRLKETRPPADEAKDGKPAPPTLEFQQVLDWCPEVSAALVTLRANGEVDAFYYRIRVGDHEATVSHHDLVSGQVWKERVRARGIGARSWREVLANIVIDQAENLGDVLAVTRTGWHVLASSLGPVYVSADGRARPDVVQVELVEAPERLVQATAPAPACDDPAGVLAEICENGGWAPLVGIAAGARSFGQSLRAVPGALVFHGDPNTGKTSSATAGRMLALAPAWPPLVTARFSDTPTDIEMKVDHEADMPTLIDDLALTRDASPMEQREAVQKLERLIRSVGNQEAVRGRRRRDLTAQEPRFVRSIPVITAQSLPPGMQASLYRRAVVIGLVSGDCDWRWWKAANESGDLDERIAPGLRTIGDRIIARLGAADEPAAVLAAADRAGLAALRPHVDEAAPGWDRSETGMAGVVDMAGAMLGGLALVADAAGLDEAARDELLARAAAPLARSLAVQADTMEDRRQVSDDLRTAIGDIIRHAMLARRAHLTGPDGTTAGTYGPAGLTYQDKGLRDLGRSEITGLTAYEGAGVALHDVPTYGGIAVRASGLHSLITASRDERAAGYSVKSIGKALARAGALVQGRGTSHVRKVRLQGETSGDWRLVLDPRVIWPDLDEDEAGPDDVDSGTTPPAGPAGPDEGPGPDSAGGPDELVLDDGQAADEPAPAPGLDEPARPADELVQDEPARDEARHAREVRTALAAGVNEAGVTWIAAGGVAESHDVVFASLPDLLAAIVERMPAGGTIAMSAAAARTLGYPDAPANVRPGGRGKRTSKAGQDEPARAVVEAGAAGWTASSAGIGAWTAWHGPGRPSVVIVVPEWVDPKAMRVNSWTYIRSDHDPLTAGYLLARYRELTGGAFTMTPGTSGVNLIKAAFGPAAPRGRRSGPPRRMLLKWDGEGTPATAVQERLIKWDRPLDEITADERAMPYAVGLDKTMAYLSAMGATVLPWDALEHSGLPESGFDASIPGYWEVSGPWQPYPGAPDLTGRDGVPGPRTVSTATVRLCLDAGMPEEMITDAWLPGIRREHGKELPRGRRMLRGTASSPGIADRLRDGLMSIDPGTSDADEALVRDALKATYRETVGMLEHGTAFVKRSDWADQIIGMTRATIFRQVVTVGMNTGRWPVRILSDCVYYAAESTDLDTKFREGWKLPDAGQAPRLGQWTMKPENVKAMSDVLSRDVHGNERTPR
jgi:hypothetical protein